VGPWQNLAIAIATPKNLHVPLPPKLYRALRDAAVRAGRPATQVARDAIVQWLQAERRREAEDELRAYVVEMAGTEHDSIEELEAASVEHLAESEKASHGRRRRR
jgi:hypothetical protein